jgi:hypothetical protein
VFRPITIQSLLHGSLLAPSARVNRDTPQAESERGEIQFPVSRRFLAALESRGITIRNERHDRHESRP